MEIKLTVLHLMFPSCFCHFSLLSKLAQGNLEQRNYLLEVFQSFQQHFVAFHDVAEDIERTLSSNIVTKVCFFFHQRVKFEHIYLTNAVKTKTEKGYLTMRGKDVKYFVQKGEKTFVQL